MSLEVVKLLFRTQFILSLDWVVEVLSPNSHMAVGRKLYFLAIEPFFWGDHDSEAGFQQTE